MRALARYFVQEISPISSFPRKRESSFSLQPKIPAFAGMTKEGAGTAIVSKAMAKSFAVHGLLVACFLYHAMPDNAPSPQFAVEVSLVSHSAMKHEPKPLVTEPLKQPEQLAKESLQEKSPSEKSLLSVPKDSSQSTQAEALSSLEPAANNTPSSMENASKIIANPVFDALMLKNPAPEYPAQAKRRRMQGVVMLKVMVGKEGQAESVVVHQSSGFALLDNAAKTSVARWRFIPAKNLLGSVAAEVLVPIEFKLKT